jgi:hypothetical protein
LDPILGLDPTGRELRDPAARLVEAQGDDGRTYTVIDFDAVHDGHESLTLNVEMVLSFMEYPMVTGLVELGKHDIPHGHFAYPTGSVWLLADILRAFGDFGQVVGLRAAMELAWLVGQILVEAGDTGPMQGCFSHGNLNPWRIALRADGEVQVLGYGLPQVELIRHRNDDGPPIDAASLRYCPPERLEGVPEDAAADTYSLVLVCFEVATGKPLYPTHDVSELERMVGMSEGARMLSRDDHGLPTKVAKVLAKALVYDPDTRLSGQDFVDAIGRLLATEPMDGASLTEVVETLQGHQKAGAPRGRKLVSAADTSMFTPDQLAEMMDDEDDEDDDDSEPKQESRWKKVDRRRADDEPEEAKPRAGRRGDAEPAKPKRRTRRGPSDADETPAKSKRRGRRSKSDDAPAPAEATAPPEAEEPAAAAEAPAEAQEPPPVEDPEAVAEPARRSRRRKAPEEEPAEPEPKPSRRRKAPADDGPDAAEPAKGSRRRRKAPEEPEPEEATDAPSDAEDDAPPTSSRRRRKAPSDDGEAPAAPSRRRRKAPEEGDDPEEAPAKDEDPPKRRRRRPVDDDDDDAPRRRRRRATDDDEDDDAPPRRRRK